MRSFPSVLGILPSVSLVLAAAGCTLDNERNVWREPRRTVTSISFHLEPECGFPDRTLDSLTRDSLYHTDDGYYASKIVYRKSVDENLIFRMDRLFDSLRIDSLSGLNVRMDPCGQQTADCKTHNVLRVRRDSLQEYSDTRRCIAYDTAFLKAFTVFENAMYALPRE